MTCDNLLSADVVTAEGECVRASETENPDLFWGLRGGGGNFGIVTAFEYRLHPVGPIVLGGMLLHPVSHANEFLRLWRDYLQTAPDEFGSAVGMLTAPPEPFVPKDLQGQPAVALIVCYAGSVEEGERALRPLREYGPPAVDLVQPMPYTVVQTLVDAGNPPGRQNYWKVENLNELSDEAIDTLVTHAAKVQSPFSFVLLEPKGRAISRVGEDEMALSHRDAAQSYYAFAMWEDPAEADIHVGWARELAAAMDPFSTGFVSANFAGDPDDPRVLSTYGPEKAKRLVALKDKYDPDNVFALNQNIQPNPRESAAS